MRRPSSQSNVPASSLRLLRDPLLELGALLDELLLAGLLARTARHPLLDRPGQQPIEVSLMVVGHRASHGVLIGRNVAKLRRLGHARGGFARPGAVHRGPPSQTSWPGPPSIVGAGIAVQAVAAVPAVHAVRTVPTEHAVHPGPTPEVVVAGVPEDEVRSFAARTTSRPPRP